MDYHALQQKLFELDPADPAEDIRKIREMAEGEAPSGHEVLNKTITETVEVEPGSVPVDKDYSVSDFAKLAGVQLNEATPLDAIKHGFKNYNKVDALNVKLDAPKDKPTPVKGTTPAPKPKPGQPAPKPQGGDWPTSKEGHTLAKGDLVSYKNAKGQFRKDVPVVDLIQGKVDGEGKPQIQLNMKGATYAISRKQIMSVNGKKFTLVDAKAGTGTIEALEARIAYLEDVIKEFVEGKKKPKLMKARDPNWRDMEALRKSGAAGKHKDKKKDAKAGITKHKKDYATESIKSQLWAALKAK
tara:strand:- start:1642 stop:2538 length:897 start_codon:yes stop_codon:yes gene_type:complete